MPSHRLKKFVIDDLEIIGYSVAGEETVIAMPQLNICFDIGKAPEQVIPMDNLFISHGHIDHTAGIAYYLSHRQFSGISPARVYMPANLIDPIRRMLDVWTEIDGNPIPGEFVPVKPGDEYLIKPNLSVKVFGTKHSRGSVGYTAVEKRKKLKPEYHGFNSQQLVEIKKKGETIDAPVEIPIVTYFGDTQFQDYSKIDYISNSKILLIECTFFDEEHDGKAQAGKHMHVDHLADLLNKTNNEHVIITHLSQRTPLNFAKKQLFSKISPEIAKKVQFLMENRHRKSL